MLSVDITKQLGAFTLQVQFETDGETMALLGASGSGKSMTLKCIAGIETPDAGRIVLNGRVLFDSERHVNLPPQKRRVGYLFQQYALFPNMNVEQNIAAGCRETDRQKRKIAVKQKIEALRLVGLEKQRPAQLSGGQQQRVALARILINEPELLLLDEPLTALDSYLRWHMEMELADAIHSFGQGALYVSHSRDEVYRMADSVCILDSGKSEKKQPVKSLFHAPKTLAACLLSGCKNYSRIQRVDDDHVEALDWGATLFVDTSAESKNAAYIGVRAHYVHLSTQAAEKNCLHCKVTRVIDDVFSTIIMLETPGGNEGHSLIRAELPKEKWAALSGNNTLYASFDKNDIMLLK